MTALLEHFHEAVTTPEDVEKVKKYILQLAMQGKLVEQDPNDEPASELLKRIEEEKQELINNRKIRKQEALPAIKEEDIPYEIPVTWEWVRIGNVTDIRRGASPRPIKNFITDSDDGIPWIKIGDSVVGNKYITTTKEKVTPEGAKKSVYLKAGSLIMSNSMSFGKAYILGIDGCIHDGWLSFTIFNKLLFDELLLLFLNGSYKQFEEMAVGTGVRNLNIDRVKGTLIPIPPLNEQRRIVEKIESLFEQCDKLSDELVKKQTISELLNKSVFTSIQDHTNPERMNNLYFVIKNMDHLCNDKESIDQLRNAVLSLAVQGKLVDQDANDDPASVLIKKVKEEKKRLVAEKLIKKEKSLPPITDSEIPYELPIGWQWVRLGDLSKVIEYGTSQKATEINVGIPVLRMNNIYEGRIIYENLKYVETSIKDLPRLYLKKGDILFNRTNSYELVGKSGCYLEDDDAYTFASYLIRVSLFKDFVIPKYISYYLNSPVCRVTQIEPYITQQNGQANFNGTKLKNVLVPLPPKEEQSRIVQKLDSIKFLYDQLEQALIKKENRRIVLMNVMGK